MHLFPVAKTCIIDPCSGLNREHCMSQRARCNGGARCANPVLELESYEMTMTLALIGVGFSSSSVNHDRGNIVPLRGVSATSSRPRPGMYGSILHSVLG